MEQEDSGIDDIGESREEQETEREDNEQQREEVESNGNDEGDVGGNQQATRSGRTVRPPQWHKDYIK